MDKLPKHRSQQTLSSEATSPCLSFEMESHQKPIHIPDGKTPNTVSPEVNSDQVFGPVSPLNDSIVLFYFLVFYGLLPYTTDNCEAFPHPLKGLSEKVANHVSKPSQS